MYFRSVYTDDLRKRLMASPEYQACVGYDQNNPHHHLPLDQHMQATEDYVEDEVPCSEWIACAAALHDIGKPAVAFTDPKTGYTRFFGHAAKSAEIAGDLLMREGCQESFAYVVCWYIRHHDDFLPFKIDPVQDHPFLRTVNVSTVAEAILKTFIWIEGSDMDVDLNATARSIMTGKRPSWGAVKPWHEIQDTCPPLIAFQHLLALCKADSRAQSEYVLNKDGSVQTTRAAKLAVLEEIEKLLPDAYRLAEEKLEIAKKAKKENRHG